MTFWDCWYGASCLVSVLSFSVTSGRVKQLEDLFFSTKIGYCFSCPLCCTQNLIVIDIVVFQICLLLYEVRK